MRKQPSPIHSLLALALVAAAGCSDSGSSSSSDPNNPSDPNAPLKTKAESFESDLPSGASNNSSGPGHSEAAGDADTATKAPSSAVVPTLNAGVVDANRAIVEADIIQIDGERLYALSRVAGLTVIDLTDPSHLNILGRYRELNGTPFEMYLQNGVVLAMYSGWGQYTKQADSWAWVQTSKVIALDVGTPSAITVAGTFDVAGDISDSRIVGDVMYVVGYQNGSCWGCDQNQPQTSVLSLNVKDPHQVSKVDELKFADANNTYGWNKRSITVTDQRMYVAGPEYGQSAPTGSTIQVIDISDPAGDLVQGATIQAAGQISSRWQMDEYQGVLRVISQIPTWWSSVTDRPSVQTFKVDSSQSLTKLASTPLSIPANETLNTVQFDGPRGYAVTSERTDPLFTIDLSDPSNPKQVGMVEMPGSLYYLAARGDRVIGLGFDQGNPAGGVTVTVFDVSNLASPKLLDRVNFGGTWASLPEDQDRIQKAFKILDDQGLILVPFSGWNYDNDGKGYCYNTYRSGTQLVDLKGDDLTLRGAAPSRGEARRAFLHNDKLLTVSDEAVDTYDISNRDAPTAAGRLTIARYVSHALPLANQTVARINEDWYGAQASTIDFVPLASADRPDLSSSELNLSELLSDNPSCNTYAWIQDAFVSGNQVNVTYQRYTYDANYYNGQTINGVLSIDATDPSKPSVLSNLKSTTTNQTQSDWYTFSGYYNYGYMPTQENVVRTDTALVFLEQQSVSHSTLGPYDPTYTYSYNTRLRVVDLTDPTKPTQGILALPTADGYSGLVVDGANVMLSHYQVSGTGKAKFYLDRIDLSTPSAPKLASQNNVPGSLLHYDKAHGRVLTSELVRTVVDDLTSEACYQRFAYADWETPDTTTYTVTTPKPGAAEDAGSVAVDADGGVGIAQPAPVQPPDPTGTCTGYTQQLQLVRFVDGGAVRDDTYKLSERERLSSSSLGDGRVAAIVSHGWTGWYSYGVAVGGCFDCGYGYGGYYGYGGSVSEPVDVLTLGGFDTGHFTPGRLSVANQQDPWWGWWGAPPVYANGNHALIRSQSDAVIVDLTDTTKPSILSKTPIYAYATDLNASGNLVIMSLGEQGVERVDL